MQIHMAVEPRNFRALSSARSANTLAKKYMQLQYTYRRKVLSSRHHQNWISKLRKTREKGLKLGKVYYRYMYPVCIV